MFSCISLSSEDNEKAIIEDEIINKVLSEGLKLKAKCKSLSRILAETEAQRSLEKADYEHAHNQLQRRYINEISTLQSSHSMEMATLRALGKKEANDLKAQCDTADGEILQLQSRCESLQTANSAMATDLYQLKHAYNKMKEANIEAQEMLRGTMVKDAIIAELRTTVQHLEHHVQEDQRCKAELAQEVSSQLRSINAIREELTTAEARVREETKMEVADSLSKVLQHNEQLREELAMSRDDVQHLNGTVNTLIAAKTAVEHGVQQVLSENASLHSQLQSFLQVSRAS